MLLFLDFAWSVYSIIGLKESICIACGPSSVWTVCTWNLQRQIQAVIDANVMPSVIGILNKGDVKIQREAAWVVRNLTTGGTLQQTDYLVEIDVLGPLINLLAGKEAWTTLVVLEAINNIMWAATQLGVKESVLAAFDKLVGLEKLDTLPDHENEKVGRFHSGTEDRNQIFFLYLCMQVCFIFHSKLVGI